VPSPYTLREMTHWLRAYTQGILEPAFLPTIPPPPDRSLRPAFLAHTGGPFHTAMFPPLGCPLPPLVRWAYAVLDGSFDELACMVARGSFRSARRAYRVTGTISGGAAAEIERLVEGARAGYITGKFPEFIERVLAADSGPRREMTEIADLRIVDTDGNETFFEIKSPKPNKGQCLEATQRLLRMHAIRGAGPPRVRAFYAMAYNPYGDDPASYAHTFANNYLDMENQVLLGRQFWEYLGDSETYDALLRVYRQVGKERGPDMLDRLALGY